eukprot:GHVR01094789.1.p1 GENE.GHVR01094789.1~~GHVR01094789.1.p1  ORF type:complete len:148 (+),score=32.14 GHVR01094789.1:161-604(+)
MSPIVGRNAMSIDTRHLTLSDSGRRMSLPTVTNTPQRGRRRDTHTCSINVLTDSTHDTNTQGEAIVDPIVEDDYEQDTPKHTHTQETTNDGTQDFPWSAEPQPISPFSYRRAGCVLFSCGVFVCACLRACLCVCVCVFAIRQKCLQQ